MFRLPAAPAAAAAAAAAALAASKLDSAKLGDSIRADFEAIDHRSKLPPIIFDKFGPRTKLFFFRWSVL